MGETVSELVAEAAVRGAGTDDTAAEGQSTETAQTSYVNNDARQQYGTRTASIFTYLFRSFPILGLGLSFVRRLKATWATVVTCLD